MTASQGQSRSMTDAGPSRWRRRRFLRLAAGGAALLPLGLLGCSSSEEPTESSAASTTALTTATSAPASASPVMSAPAQPSPPLPAATASAPGPTAVTIELSPAPVGIGETMRVRVAAPAASAVVVEFMDASYRMFRQPDGMFWLAVGVPLDAALGTRVLRVATRDALGATIASAESRFEVVAVGRPVDFLLLTPDESAVLTPDAGVRESELRGLQFAQFDAVPRWTALFLRPVDGAITTQFGEGRSINGGPVGAFHTGVDLANAEGTPVLVAAPGRVGWAGAMPIRGNSVIVDHGGGVKSGYHHLSAITATAGQEVEAGEVVGLVGMTGLSTGPHLHWEVSLWGVNVDPMTWLTTRFGPEAPALR